MLLAIKLYLLLLSIIITFQVLASSSTEERLSNIEEQLLDMQINQRKSPFMMNGYLINRYNQVRYKASKDDTGHDTVSLLKIDFKLNFNAPINNRARFYSSIGMTKYYNTYTKNNTTGDGGNPETMASDPLWDLRGSHNPDAGPLPFIDKAYFDYDLLEKLIILSAGRFPTSFGPPMEFKDDIPRQGTYPLLGYNMILDGIALTAKADHFLPSNQNLKFQFFYTPLQNVNFANPYRPLTHKDKNGNTVKMNNYRKFYSVIIDYKINNLSFARNFHIIYHFHNTPKKMFAPIVQFSGDTLKDMRTDYGATIKAHNIVLALENIFNNIDFYTSLAWNKKTTTGDVYHDGTLGPPAGTPYGYENGVHKGKAILVGLNYQFPRMKYKTILGAEFLTSNKHYDISNGIKEDLTNFYDTRGKAYQFYWTQGFAPNMQFRIGYLGQHFSSKPGTTSGNVFDDTTQEFSTYYGNLRVTF